MADLKATLKTNRGDIVINLFPNHAPEADEVLDGLGGVVGEEVDDDVALVGLQGRLQVGHGVCLSAVCGVGLAGPRAPRSCHAPPPTRTGLVASGWAW